ncbi:ISNCY family transposase [Candidatus Sumerlaeota bacterium]|nr:ISNCY family transposase [Candidatus Sumerlaeota bacterium]
MHQRNQPQRELFDAYVRDFNTIGCVKEKWLKDLQVIDRILDDNPKIAVLVEADLNRHVKSPVGAKPKLTAEQTVRLAVLKQLKGYSYRALEEHVDNTPLYRQFTRFYGGAIPDFSTMERAIKEIRPGTWEAINTALVGYAVAKKVEDGKRLRTDTMVIETDIAQPVDARLLCDGVRVLTRLMERVRKRWPALAFPFAKRTRRAKKRCYAIVMAKGAKAQERRQKWYRDLLAVVQEVLAMGRACAEALRPLVASGDIGAKAFLQEIEKYLGRCDQARQQCVRRVLRGENVPAAEKIVSLFEEHTDIICRGKKQSPTEFGHKVEFTTGRSPLITHFAVVRGNPGDDQLLEPMLDDHVRQFGAAPEELTGDRRFHHAEAVAREKGIERIALPKPGARNLLRRALEKSRWFRRLLRFRAGIEGVISTLMRTFGLTRCLWEGWASFCSYVGLAVVTYNLRYLAWALT